MKKILAIVVILVLSQTVFSQIRTKRVVGKMKGVVELGSSGFNSFIITVDSNKNWQLEKAEYGESGVLEGLATLRYIEDGLKKFIQMMLDYGVSREDIHFVVSSDAVMEGSVYEMVQELELKGYRARIVYVVKLLRKRCPWLLPKAPTDPARPVLQDRPLS